MISRISRLSFKEMSHEEWLAQRRKTIGGSDAGAIVGFDPFSGPYTVWADKTGRLPDKEDTESMRLGRDLEEYVAKRFSEETGKKVKRDNNFVYNSKYPFAHVQADRLIIGENAGLECKTTNSLDIKQFKDVEFPKKYYAQCVHALAVTGLSRWYLAVLVFGRGFYTYALDRDEAEINALMNAEETFWKQFVETDTAPAPDGTDATTETIKTIYEGGHDNATIDLFGRDSLIDEYFTLKRQNKAIDERITEIENIIKNDLKDTENGESDRYSVYWRTQTRNIFQPKDFAKAHPEIDLAPFYKASTSRPFRIKEKVTNE